MTKSRDVQKKECITYVNPIKRFSGQGLKLTGVIVLHWVGEGVLGKIFHTWVRGRS